MKINNLKINGFGKIENKEMEFSDGINVIKGQNESGKSTLLKFITAMLYGTSRNKNGKAISDFEKYKPWGKDEYSGRLEYELDDGKKYEIFREFKKKSPVLYDESKSDVSKNYTIETTRGNLFFTEQTGVPEENFLASCVAEQENVRMSDNTKNALIQRLGNIVSSGNENASHRIAMDRLNRKQTTEVGNNRTSGRPLNIVEKELERYETERLTIEQYKDEKYKVDTNKETIQSEISDNSVILDLLRQQKVNLEKTQIEQEKINIFKQALEKEKENKGRIEEKIDSIEEEKIEKGKTNKTGYLVCIIAIIVITVVSIVFKIWTLCALNVIPTIGIICIAIKNNKKKRKAKLNNKKIYQEKAMLEAELDKVEKELGNNEKELKEKQNSIYRTQKSYEDWIKEQFEEKLDKNTIEDILSTKYEKIVEFIDEKEREIADFRVKEKTIEVDNAQAIKKLDRLVEIDEKIEELKEKKEELTELNKMYNIVKEELENSFQEIKENITPEFINELNNIIKIVTNGKYKNVFLDRENNILIETEDGQYMPIYMLSTGTIDLIYFALRISAAKEISQENMPIILDESFAYYDNDRMTETLKYLNTLENRQVMLFTCSNREIEILDRENIRYNVVEM